MKIAIRLFLLVLISIFCNYSYSQKVIEEYEPAKSDSIRIGVDDEDFLPFIQSGYTLMTPEDKAIKGVLILLEDSGYDKKNNSSKQIYIQAAEKGFAVLSVSTEIPFDFYFYESSFLSTSKLIEKAFLKHNLPNKNIFFLGASLVGHRAMRYVKFMKEGDYEFKLKIDGLVICNFTLDWTRKWYQHIREIRIKRNDLWEPTFINYMLETHLNGTPKTNPEAYRAFSSYSYFDDKNENLKLFKSYAVRAYIEPAIKYRFTKYLKTLYENNSTDVVSFLAELELTGNENTELIVIQEGDDPNQTKNAQTTWDSINKDELLNWVQKQTEQ